MIKGVNKKIIEINSTGSIYFEKVVFYLKPNVIELPCAVAEVEARRYIENFEVLSDRRGKKLSRKLLLVSTFVLVAGGAIICKILC